MLRCYDITILRITDVTMFRFDDVALTMLCCCSVTMLRWYIYNITLLRCYAVTMLRPRVDFLCVRNEMRPYFVIIKTHYNTAPIAAFIPWLNGFVWFGIWYWAKSKRYPMTKRVCFLRYIIPSQKRPLSRLKTALFLSAYNTVPKAAGSGFHVSRSLCTCA